MGMAEAPAGWARSQPPLFLWGAVVLSPAVMGLAGEGAPSRLGLAAIGLFLALGFFELASRQAKVPSVLVALLYVVLSTALAGPPLSLIDAIFAAATLVSGALCASICSGLARTTLLGRVPALATYLVSAGFLTLIALGPDLALWSQNWLAGLQTALSLAAIAALIHSQMLGITGTLEGAGAQRIWMGEVLSLLVGFGLVLLLTESVSSGRASLWLALMLLLVAVALRGDVGPRVVTVTAVLYLSAHAAPLGPASWLQLIAFLSLLLVAFAPPRALWAETEAIAEEPLWFTALQPAAEAWMVTFDLGRDQVILGPAAQAHFGAKRRLAVWLEQLSPEQSERLLALLQGHDPAPVTLPLRSAKARDSANPYSIHLLEREGSLARVVLRKVSAEAALRERIAAQQAELDRIRLREERLLALASHELRTPIASLSMIAEELDDGASWDELSPALHLSMKQVLGVLDDLRAGGKGAGAVTSAGELSLPQLTQWLREEFGPLAETLGVSLHLDLPAAEGLSYRCEAGRLLLVLEKLLRHLLSLPDLRGLRLSLVTMPLGGDRLSLLWTLTPSGAEKLPMPAPDLFEPFATGPDAGLGSELQGAGLYTAQKAALAMGGTLRVAADPAGYLFVFSHPVRRLSPLPQAKRI